MNFWIFLIEIDSFGLKIHLKIEFSIKNPEKITQNREFRLKTTRKCAWRVHVFRI